MNFFLNLSTTKYNVIYFVCLKTTTMKFSIITPTYNRANLLTRAVESALKQSYTNWEMIIVNDSPDDERYNSFEKNNSDQRIIYLKNDQNAGVNFSRNRALDNVSKNSDWVIFLDDDDYLTPDALATFCDLIQGHPDKKWFVTNLRLVNGKTATSFPKSNTSYSYALEYLILKRCKGDVTHCLGIKLINASRFSKYIKQAEEWLFFYQIGLKEKMYYQDHVTKIIAEYDSTRGLSLRKRTRGEQLKTLSSIIREGYKLHVLHHPTFFIYICMRLARIFIKNS